jgi:AraC family transcriptional activator FtrA
MSKHLVVALAYDQLCTFEYGCVVEVYGLPRPELKGEWYEFATCAATKRPLRAAGGLSFSAAHSLALLDEATTIIIPGWYDDGTAAPAALVKRLQRAHARGACIASICSGVFLLAATGLLNGRRATTHWRFAERLASRHPEIEVDPQVLYVDEGQLLTSAGSAAGLDMMLHMVRRDRGAQVANAVARRLVIAPHREGGQAQFVPRPLYSGRSQLSRLMDTVRRHPGRTHTLASMAAQAAVSPRTLQRQFRESTGLTPIEWVVRERVSIAKDLLESAKLPAAAICEKAGFGSEESFRRHFREQVGLSPSAYRRQFSRAKT